MKYKKIYKAVKEKLSKKRWEHTKGVIKAAKELATYYGADVEKAMLAALLHDCCKEEPNEKLREILMAQCDAYSDAKFLDYPSLLHGPAGALYAELEFGITDEEILEAIRVHTVGKAQMSLLDKIVFLADYIEPNRDFPGVEDLRKEAKENIDAAVLMAYDNTIAHLIDIGAPVYEGTMTGRNYMLGLVKEQNK